jgi:hypothetical protein
VRHNGGLGHVWALKLFHSNKIVNVPTSVGKPKTFDLSIATYVALKGRLPPQSFRSCMG